MLKPEYVPLTNQKVTRVVTIEVVLDPKDDVETSIQDVLDELCCDAHATIVDDKLVDGDVESNSAILRARKHSDA